MSRLRWRCGLKFRALYQKYMLIVGLMGGLLFYLQAAKIYFYGSAQDLSLTGFVISWLSLLSWLGYGILLKDRVLIVVNISGILGASLVIFLKLHADGIF